MKQDTYFVILQALAAHGVNKTQDISACLRPHFLDQHNIGNVVFVDLNKAVEEYMSQMKAVGHVIFTNTTPDQITVGKAEYWKYINVTASITPQGLLFYYQKLQIDAVEKSGRWAKRGIYLAAFLALLSLIISALTFIKALSDTTGKQHVQILEKQLSQQGVELIKQQTLLHQMLVARADSARADSIRTDSVRIKVIK